MAKKSAKTSQERKVIVISADHDELLLQELQRTKKTFSDVSNELSKNLEYFVASA